jgi:hypothetical protein
MTEERYARSQEKTFEVEKQEETDSLHRDGTCSFCLPAVQ